MTEGKTISAEWRSVDAGCFRHGEPLIIKDSYNDLWLGVWDKKGDSEYPWKVIDFDDQGRNRLMDKEDLMFLDIDDLKPTK